VPREHVDDENCICRTCMDRLLHAHARALREWIKHNSTQRIELALSMAGDAGEAANIVKKSWRDGKPLNREKLAEEIAGTACYLVGLAAAINLDLDAEMVKQMAAFEARYS